MSLNQILDGALTGLSAAQAGLRSVSNNIANAQTPGYARQRAVQTSAVTAGRTTGVAISEPSRIADRYLEGAVYTRGGEAQRNALLASYHDRVQSLFGKPGATSGLPAQINAVMSAAAKMTGMSDPTEAVANFTQSVDGTIAALRTIDGELAGMAQETRTTLDVAVLRANALVRQVYDLNEEIASRSAAGGNANGPLDQRQLALDELSGLVQLKVINQPDSRVTLETATGAVLLDRRMRQLDTPDASGAIAVRLMTGDANGSVATGDKIVSAAVGGKIGGLIEVRDRVLPGLSAELNTLFTGMATALNAVSNASSAVPAPPVLQGRSSGLRQADRLGFTGATTFAVVAGDGKLIAKTRVDLGALGPNATVKDALDAINVGLAGKATATMVNGVLSLTAADPAQGVVVAEDAGSRSDRAGVGFSQFFGLNDLVRSAAAPLAPTGLTAADPHGFGPGESVGMEVRDAAGTVLARHVLTGSGGGTNAALLAELNASPLAGHGSFSMDGQGHVMFAPTAGPSAAKVAIVNDTTDRFGTGLRFSEWSGLSPQAGGLADSGITAAMAAGPRRVPLARFDTSAAVGTKALSAGDVRGTTAFVTQLSAVVDFTGRGSSTIAAFANRMIGNIGVSSAGANAESHAASARFDDAVTRRDNFSGVNTEEELALMVTLKGSYNASARVVSVTAQMYDTLINMID